MSIPAQAIDLHLTLEPGEEGTSLVTLRRRGETTALAAAPAGRSDRVRDFLPALADYCRTPFPVERLCALGRELARLLLPPDVRDCLRVEMQRAAGPSASVRLWLHLAAPEMRGLPWEFLSLEEERISSGPGGFLALTHRLHLIRQTGSLRPLDPLPTDPLRVLVCCADPGTAAYPPLSTLEVEAASVEAALRVPECRHVHVEVLRDASPDRLRRALRDRPPHILHYIGHGDRQALGGFLVMAGERAGAEARLYADELARWVAGSPLRLVVLSACHTASAMGGIAGFLTEAGVPAVVAMQLAMRETMGGAFARAFYGTLATQAPVEEAVWQARQAVQGFGPDWGVPALSLSVEHGSLFRLPPAVSPAVILPEEPPIVLPYRHNPDFVGRDREMERLHAALQDTDAQPVALVGLGGLGKSQMAVEYAHAYRADYPGGVFWINARNTERVKDDYAALGSFFDIPDSLSPQDRAHRVQQRLQRLEQPALLLFDSVTEETDLKLLPAFGPCRILLTTRRRNLTPYGAQVIELAPLDESSALSLLFAHNPPRNGPEEEAARQIVTLLGGLPLALALVANHIRRCKLRFADFLSQLHEDLRSVIGPIRPPLLPTEHDGRVFAAIEIACRTLDSASRSLLTAAACFAGRGISRDILYDACRPLPRAAFDSSLADLEESCLLTCQEDDRMMIHALVRAYAQGSVAAEDLAETLLRVSRTLAARLRAANEANDWREVRPEMAHCRAAAELGREKGLQEGRWELLCEMGGYLFEHGDAQAARRCFEEGLPLADRLFGRRSPQAAQFLMRLGVVKAGMERQGRREGPSARACAEEALAIAEATLPPEDPERAEYYNSLGYVLRWEGDLEGALDRYRTALAIRERESGGASAHVAVCLNNIGIACEAQGNLSAALDFLDRGLAMDRLVYGPQHPQIAILLNNTGRLLGRLGAWEEAAARHREALAIYESTFGPEHPDVAMSHLFLAGALHGQGRLHDALLHGEEARALLERLQRRYGPLEALMRMVQAELDSMRQENTPPAEK